MINPQKLHTELLNKGLPVDGVRLDAVVDWTRDLTETEAEAAERLIEVHDPTEIELPSLEDRISSIEDAILYQVLGG
jgi:hypothetical protein